MSLVGSTLGSYRITSRVSEESSLLSALLDFGEGSVDESLNRLVKAEFAVDRTYDG